MQGVPVEQSLWMAGRRGTPKTALWIENVVTCLPGRLSRQRMAAGIVDDIYGANFVSGGTNGDIMDQNGHGTFVAGVVGAVTNNALGVTGINQVQRLPLCSLLHANMLGLATQRVSISE